MVLAQLIASGHFNLYAVYLNTTLTFSYWLWLYDGGEKLRKETRTLYTPDDAGSGVISIHKMLAVNYFTRGHGYLGSEHFSLLETLGSRIDLLQSHIGGVLLRKIEGAL